MHYELKKSVLHLALQAAQLGEGRALTKAGAKRATTEALISRVKKVGRF